VSVSALPKWRTLGELANATGLSEWRLRAEIKAGNLRARRIGRCLRVLDEDAALWMRGQNGNGSAEAEHVTDATLTSPTPTEASPRILPHRSDARVSP